MNLTECNYKIGGLRIVKPYPLPDGSGYEIIKNDWGL